MILFPAVTEKSLRIGYKFNNEIMRDISDFGGFLDHINDVLSYDFGDLIDYSDIEHIGGLYTISQLNFRSNFFGTFYNLVSGGFVQVFEWPIWDTYFFDKYGSDLLKFGFSPDCFRGADINHIFDSINQIFYNGEIK